ncbi:MAG TPA: hypothetical protein VNZ45_06570, partial [Bacteroidia bacterium]|nr:hypothetical protein [Bacteroidia bacterium]
MRSFTNFCIKFLFLIAMLYCGKAQSQVEQGEEGAVYWGQCLENFRTSLALSPDDFLLFYRFEEIKLDTLRAQFMRDMRTCKTASSAMDEMMKSKQSQITDLYGLFEKVNAEYPSSVDQYRKSNAHRFMALCDTSGCANTGFEDGTLNGWNAYYGYNSNAGSFNFFNVTNITGGPAGPVTEAANDVLTSTSGFYSWGIGVNPSPDYQISIVSGSRSDALIPSLPVVSPYGGKYSVMLGDSTLVNYGTAILSKTFLVTPNNTDFIYQYAIVLENPNAHTYYEQPFFQVALLDQNGDTITNCGKYSVVSSGGRSQGFKSVFVPANGPLGNDSAYYRDWTVVCVPLRNYIGQCVTIIFEAGDCSRSSHFGYAYVDASCAPLEIIPSSPSFCGQKTITLTGPPGFTIYQWSGPGIVGPTNTQSIAINTVGKYQLIAVPVTGVACDDTLTINVTDTTGHPTEPSFTASAACAGGVMQFTNTSV